MPAEHHLLNTQSPGLQSSALYNSLSAVPYHGTQQTPPLHPPPGHHARNCHTCPLNEHPTRDIVEEPQGLACTPCKAWLAHHSAQESMVTASPLTKVWAFAFEGMLLSSLLHSTDWPLRIWNSALIRNASSRGVSPYLLCIKKSTNSLARWVTCLIKSPSLMREHSDIMHSAGRKMTFASVPGCMDLSTALSLNSRSAMCIPLSHIFSTVSSHFSLAPEMHNEASRVRRSMDCNFWTKFCDSGDLSSQECHQLPHHPTGKHGCHSALFEHDTERISWGRSRWHRQYLERCATNLQRIAWAKFLQPFWQKKFSSYNHWTKYTDLSLSLLWCSAVWGFKMKSIVVVEDITIFASQGHSQPSHSRHLRIVLVYGALVGNPCVARYKNTIAIV